MTDEFIAGVKQCVADPAAGPSLNDLVNAEAGRLVEGLRGDEFDLGAGVSDEGVIQRLDRYAALTGDLGRAVALGARWSGDLVRALWRSVLERVVEAIDRGQVQTTWADLSFYPGVLLLSAAGIGAIAGERYDNPRAILLDPRILRHNEWSRAVEVLIPHTVMDTPQAQRVAGLSATLSPVSDRLAADVRPLVGDVIPDDAAFNRIFDRFEYLLGLVHLDVTRTDGYGWGPVGRFGSVQYGGGIETVVEDEIKEAGGSWPPLVAGLFQGSPERLEASLVEWRKHVESARRDARIQHMMQRG